MKIRVRIWPLAGLLVAAAIWGGLITPGRAAEEAPAPAPAEAGAIPAEPFAATSGNPSDFSAAAPAAPGTSRDNPGDPGREKLSLWDLFTSFFSLGAPGDPNHPDKLRLTVGTTLGYDDNVLTTKTDRIASGTAGLNGTLSYNFGSERLKIASSLALGALYYQNRPGDNTDYNGTFSGQVAYFVTRRLQLTGNLSVAYLSQPNPTLIGGVSRFNGDYTALSGGIGASYSLQPRLSLRMNYRTNSITYTDKTQNDSLGFTDQTYSLGLDYLISPRLTLTTDYRYNPLTYQQNNQGSVGHILTVGFQSSFTPKFTWALQFGAEMRLLNNSQQTQGPSQYIGPFLETDMQYGFAPNSAVTATVRYGTEPSGSAGISVRETLRATLGVTYAFTGRLAGTAALSYEHDHYDQPGSANDFSQVYNTASLGLKFQINPALALTAQYDYSIVQSDQEFNDYTRSVTTLGLQFIF